MEEGHARQMAAGPALLGIAAISALATILRATRPLLAGPDPFWHWDLGRRIWNEGVISSDPYSFLTEGQTWVLNQWGADAVFGLVDRLGGLGLLAAFTALLVGGIYLHAGWRMWQRAPSLLSVFLLGLAFMAGLSNMSMRGNLFTFLLLPLVLAEVQREGGPRPVRLLAVMVLWANLHTAYLFGVLTVALHGVGKVAITAPDNRGHDLLRWGGLVVGSLVASIVSPYGWALLVQTFRLSLRGGVGITEWAPPSLTGMPFLPFALLLAIALTAVGFHSRRDDLPDLLLVVGFSLLGMTAIRNVAPSAIILGIVSAPHVYRTACGLRGRAPGSASRVGPFDRGAATMLAVVPLTLLPTIVPMTNRVAAHATNLPTQAISEIGTQGRPAQVFTTTAWAAATAILGSQNVKTAVDGRLELFTGTDLADYRLVNSADPGWEDQLDEWRVTDVLVMEETPMALALKESDEWALAMTHDLGADGEAHWYTRAEVS